MVLYRAAADPTPTGYGKRWEKEAKRAAKLELPPGEVQ